MLNHQKILLGVTGSIAAYKSALLVRELREQGAEVRVVLTENAKQFVAPLTLQALSGNGVRDQLFDREAEQGMGHIELARWADLVVIAPASANFIARLANGFSDDLLTTLCLATEAKIFVAPAMNQKMWRSAFVRQNLKNLLACGIEILGPGSGEQACGEVGEGRLLEPAEIVAALPSNPKIFLDKTMLITAGPTCEALDPVRYLSNHSSGKMGYALAHAANQMGAKVILVSGPTQLASPAGVHQESVRTARQMQAVVKQYLSLADIFIGCAAVADYRPAVVKSQKIKKSSEKILLELIRNPDILVEVAQCANRPELVIGFAAETENLIENATRKLTEKHLDAIIANQVSDDQGFHQAHNQATLIYRDGTQKTFPSQSKRALAVNLLRAIHS